MDLPFLRVSIIIFFWCSTGSNKLQGGKNETLGAKSKKQKQINTAVQDFSIEKKVVL